MPDTNTPTIDQLQESVTRLEAALAKERADRKASKAALLAPIRTALALGEDSSLDDVTAALSKRLNDTEAVVTERMAELQTQHDELKAKHDTLTAERAESKITAALEGAFAQSGIRPEHKEDYIMLARSVVEVTDAGDVRTKAHNGTIPGMTVLDWARGQLIALRPHWMTPSVGGGARGGSLPVSSSVGDDSCFDKSSKHFNYTRMAEYEARFGPAAAERARQKYSSK